MNVKKLLVLILAGILAISFVGCGPSEEEEQAVEEEAAEETLSLVKEAYAYTYPLVLMDATKKAGTNTADPTDRRAPINQFMHAGEEASPDYKDITSPDAKMFYSQIFLNLSSDAVVLHKPYATRFLSLEILDAWSNCVTILGSGGDEAGDTTYLLTGPDFEGEVPYYMTQVKVPTSMGWVLGRIECNGKNDVTTVEYLQKNLTAKALTFYESGEELPVGVYDKSEDYVPAEHVNGLSAKDYFDTANELMKENPPAKDDAELLKKLETIGVGPGLTFDESVISEDAWAEMKAALPAELATASADQFKTNGIFRYGTKPIADFGTDYNYRALVAMTQFGALPEAVSVNLQADVDADGNPLIGKAGYKLHFDADKLPPVKYGGSWAITAYDKDGYLIDNDIDRNCIDDDSELTYNDDGSLDIYIQYEDPEKENMGKNWLPVKSGEFQISLRIYLPEDSVLSGDWKAPKLSKNKK